MSTFPFDLRRSVLSCLWDDTRYKLMVFRTIDDDDDKDDHDHHDDNDDDWIKNMVTIL